MNDTVKLKAFSPESFCDFCRDQPVVWLFPCEDFIIDSTPGFELMGEVWSRGGWCACAGCAVLVEDGGDAARDAMAERAAERLTVRLIFSHETTLAMARCLHDQFFAHRIKGEND